MALSTRRVILAPPDESEGVSGQRFPDVGILASQSGESTFGASVATAPLILQANFPEPIPHVSVEIRDVAEPRLVTCIEVLSPTNKRGPGREEYAAKRFNICSGNAHLVEIDLLRAGARFPTAKLLPTCPYFVFVSQTGQRNEVGVWPMKMEDPLRAIPVPLLPGDSEVLLDLQQALSVIYEIIGYDELVDYSKPPPGPLTSEESAWIEEQLRRIGKRQAINNGN